MLKKIRCRMSEYVLLNPGNIIRLTLHEYKSEMDPYFCRKEIWSFVYACFAKNDDIDCIKRLSWTIKHATYSISPCAGGHGMIWHVDLYRFLFTIILDVPLIIGFHHDVVFNGRWFLQTYNPTTETMPNARVEILPWLQYICGDPSISYESITKRIK